MHDEGLKLRKVVILERTEHAGIVGPHLGWSVDEDAIVKLTEAQ